jgi:hypothetical protein
MGEVLVATALSGIILAGAVYMFGQSVDVSTIATLRGDMQQNARVAINLIYRDLLVAGTGLPAGGVQLPVSIPGPLYPQLGCDMTLKCWIIPGGQTTGSAQSFYQTTTTFPALQSANAWMYWINPMDGCNSNTGATCYNPLGGAYTGGPTISQPNDATPGNVDRDPWSSSTTVTTVPTDMVTIVYKDNNYPTNWLGSAGAPLDQLPLTNIVVNGSSSVTVTFDPTTNPPVDDAAYGLQLGDILFFNNSIGQAVGTVTNIVGASGTTGAQVTMSTNSDPLNFNYVECPQVGQACTVGSGGLSSIQTLCAATTVWTNSSSGYSCAAGSTTVSTATGTFPTTKAFRLVVVTYYIDSTTYPTTPRLMRQVNALTPTPVAQNIENLQFSYDIFDSTTDTICPNVANPYNPSTACSTGASYSPNQIGKVNIFVQARSSGQRLVQRGYSRFSMISAVTPRNMDFLQRY